MTYGRFFYRPTTKKFTLTATTEASTYDVENVLTPFVENTWRSTTNGTQYITFSGAGERNVRAVFIGNHNLSTYSTFEVQGSNDNFSTHTDVAVTVVTKTRYRLDSYNEIESYTRRDAYALFSAVQSFRYYRVKMVSTLPYYEAGFIGLYYNDYTISNNWIQRFRGGIKTVKDIIQGTYGQTSSKLYFQRHEFDFSFRDSLSLADSQILENIIPLSETCVFSPDSLTTLYLVEVFVDEPLENLQGLDTGNKSLQIKLIEKI